jgi:hypothetical protein
MSVRRFPCRWCGDLTEGLDLYVLCDPCQHELAWRGVVMVTPFDGAVNSPMTPEVEARLRKLLDGW